MATAKIGKLTTAHKNAKGDVYTTVRLEEDVRSGLEAYIARTGAQKVGVINDALKRFLGEYFAKNPA